MITPSDRLSAALADRYRIVRELGAGGMATVYLAEDLKHDRKVAIKVLKPELAAVLGADRFVVEIKTTAAMSHPHILPLFDSGTADGFLYYVMPFIEGETIREKLNRETQFGVDEAVRIAREVADALDYAHRHGIIHRDIKPENILLHDGRAMVMDFGIALAVSAAAGGRMTETGLSLGTPHYMSPEQATAEKEISPRSDVYSLASVLYEMLAGEPPHSGGSAQAIIMKIIAEPAQIVTKLRKSVPTHVAAALDKALQKVPADRFESAAKFADALANPAFATANTTLSVGGVAASRGVSLGVFAATAVAAVIGFGLAAWAWKRPAMSQPETSSVQFSIELPDSVRVESVSVSPDGTQIVIGAYINGQRRLLSRTIDDVEVRFLEGTEGGARPFFSPDGEWIGFFMNTELRKVPRQGGVHRTLASGVGGTGAGTWGADGTIVLSGGFGGLMRVDHNGGPMQPFTTLDSTLADLAHVQPRFLADGKTVSFQIAKDRGGVQTELGLVALDGKVTRQKALDGGWLVPLSNDSVVMFNRRAGLSIATYDSRQQTIGPLGPSVVTDVLTNQGNRAVWDLSKSRTLAYLRGGLARRLVTVTRAGATQLMLPDARAFRRPRPSPDGQRIVIEVMGATSSDAELWVLDRQGGTLQRLTFGGGVDAVWTTDSKRVVFSRRDSAGSNDLFWQLADGSAPAEQLLARPGRQFALAATPDGKGIVVDDLTEIGSNTDIWLLSLEGDRALRPVLVTEFVERLPTVSPDGKWMAYTSNESGRVEVYVRPFPGPGAKVQISVTGGDQPTWSRTGREIFYRDATKMVSAAVETSFKFTVTSRTPLFDDPFLRTGTLDYEVLPDGGFVMLQPDVASKLIVITNWPSARAGTGSK